MEFEIAQVWIRQLKVRKPHLTEKTSIQRFFWRPLRTPIIWPNRKLLLDGNKRAALDVALTFLAINWFEIEDEEMELYDAMIAIAEKRMSKEQMADLFEQLVTKWWFSRALILKILLSLT